MASTRLKVTAASKVSRLMPTSVVKTVSGAVTSETGPVGLGFVSIASASFSPIGFYDLAPLCPCSSAGLIFGLPARLSQTQRQ